MNVQEGLQEIRQRLVDNDAQPASIQTVDMILKRAALPAASSATANSLLQLTRMLMRTPVANQDPRVYDDFVRIEADLESKAETYRAQRAEDESRPLPKSRKFYKQQQKKAEQDKG